MMMMIQHCRISGSGGLDFPNITFGVMLNVDWNRRVWL